MSGTADDADWSGPHWQFGLALYSAERVREACLSLQNRFVLDVSFLFVFLYYAARRGLLPTDDIVSDALRLTEPIRAGVIHPLRRIRDGMKQSPVSDLTERNLQLRKSVLQAELQAEQLEQAVLAQLLEHRLPHAALPSDGDFAALIVAILSRFSGGRTPPADDPDVAAIAEAVRSVSREGSPFAKSG